MGKYAVSWNNSSVPTGLTTKALINTNAALEIAEIIEVLVTGAGAASPQDIQISIQAGGCTVTTAGTTGAAFTPVPMTGGIMPASNLVANTSYTGEPTVFASASVVYGINQRGGMCWSVPQGEGFRLVGATNQTNCGFGVRLVPSTTTNCAVDGHVHFWEP